MNRQRKGFINQIIKQCITMLMLFWCLGFVMTGCGKEITVPSYDDEVIP